jgi:hypothetical protein
MLVAHLSKQSMHLQEERMHRSSSGSMPPMAERSSDDLLVKLHTAQQLLKEDGSTIGAKLHMAQQLLQDVGLSARFADQRHIRDAWKRSERSISVLVSCLQRDEFPILDASGIE